MLGLSMFLQTDPALRDEKCKRNLVKQWHWLYTSHVIQGLGMAAVNFYALNEKNVMYSAYYEPFDACIKSSSFVDDAKSKAYFAALSADAKKKYMADSYVERCR